MIIKAISNLRPNSSFTLMTDEFESLIWQDEKTSAPTKEEVLTEAARLQAEYDAKEYARKRAPEYPSIGDQLDALFKAGAFPADMAAKIKAVKDKYPKA